MAPLLIPSFFVLESGGKYLSVTGNNSKSSLPSGFVKFNEENIWSPRTKFAAEPAETRDGALVHIRSCYNNKYLVKEQIGDSFCIVASAKKPEEDRTKETCTLFEPHSLVSEVEQTSVRLRHVQTQIFATHDGNDQHAMLISSGPGSALRVIDSKSLVVLPSLVAFKTNEKDRAKYCCSRNLDPRWPYQRFEDGLDIGDLRVAKEMFPTAQGNYRVKDLYFDKFWRRSPNWIWGDAQSSNTSNDTLFSVVQIGDNVIALKNLGNNNFCGPLTTEGKTDCLNACYSTLTNPTMLVLEETVLQRNISGIDYRLSDSRIYGEQNIECDTTYATNDTDEKANITLNFSFTDAKTTSWNDSVSVKFGGKITFETAIIPLITTVEVELSIEAGYTHAWGESTTITFKRESTYSVPVPKKTTVKVTMICSRALCDVPFYYTQTDLLPNGEWVTTIKDDGLFTGMNSYNFRFKSEVVPNPLKN